MFRTPPVNLYQLKSLNTKAQRERERAEKTSKLKSNVNMIIRGHDESDTNIKHTSSEVESRREMRRSLRIIKITHKPNEQLEF